MCPWPWALTCIAFLLASHTYCCPSLLCSFSLQNNESTGCNLMDSGRFSGRFSGHFYGPFFEFLPVRQVHSTEAFSKFYFWAIFGPFLGRRKVLKCQTPGLNLNVVASEELHLIFPTPASPIATYVISSCLGFSDNTCCCLWAALHTCERRIREGGTC